MSRGLLEREAELASLTELITTDRRDGIAVTIAGPGGVGKTRLVEAAVDLARERGYRVAQGRGGELERALPYTVVQQALLPEILREPKLLEGPAAAAGEALGLGGDATMGLSSERVPLAMWWLCVALTAQGPVLLALDDVHWADDASLAWISYLQRRLEGVPLILLISTRRDEPGSNIDMLERLIAESAIVLEPPALSEDGCRVAIEQRLGQEPRPDVTRACFRASGGNPFLLLTVLDELANETDLVLTMGADVLDHLDVRSVAPLALTRMARAHPAAPAFARALAVLGTSAQFRHVAAVAAIDIETAERAGDALRRAHVINDDAEPSFVHPLLRSAIYRELPAGELSVLHRRAAEVLNADGASADRVGGHLLRVAPAADTEVAAQLLAATDEAMRRGSPHSAAEFALRVLAEPPPRDSRTAVLRRLAAAQALVGQTPNEALLEARSFAADPIERLALTIEIVRRHRSWRELPTWAAAIAEDLESAGDAPVEMTSEARFYLAEGLALEGADHYGAAAMDATIGFVGLADGLAPGPFRRTLALRELEHAQRRSDFTWEDDKRLMLKAVHAAPPDPSDAGFASHLSAVMWLLNTDYEDATLEAIAELRSAAETFGSERCYAHVRHLECAALLRWGSLRDAEAAGQEALKLLGRQGERLPFPRAFTDLAIVQLQRGALDHAAVTTRKGLEESPDNQYLRGVAGVVAAMGGADFAMATGDITVAIDADERSGLVNLLESNPHRAEVPPLLAVAGFADEARWWAEQLVLRQRRYGAPAQLGMAMTALGRVQARPRAIETLLAASGHLEKTPRRFEFAKAQLALGEVLRRDGARQAARAPLRRALELATAISADEIARRADEELRAAGARPRQRTPGARESLSVSEMRVASLAARNHTVREIAQRLFLSPKTVEMHLSRCYRKLGVKDRGALARALGVGLVAADGTTTIVFTDIVNSTRMNVTMGDAAWHSELTVHEDRVRLLAVECRGTVIKSTGDGFMLAFPDPSNAATFGRRLKEDRGHRALRLAVRVGMHRGSPIERDGDLFGEDVALAARVCAAAESDQVLITDQLAAAIDGPVGPARTASLKGFQTVQVLRELLPS